MPLRDEIAELLRMPEDGGGTPAEELAIVARRLSDTSTELKHLRRVLARLRARTRAARA